jgi:hypothetical protein
MWVLGDAVEIVKVPPAIQRVGVNQKKNKGQGDRGEKKSPAE